MPQILYLKEFPDLNEVQRASYCWFLKKGLSEEFENISSIYDFSGNTFVHIYGQEYKLKKPRYSLFETKQRDATYAIRIYVPVQILGSTLDEIKPRNIFFGEIPLMTDKGTFIINGCERVIINQLIRSPGIYYRKEKIITGRKIYSATLISNRGSWLKFEFKRDKLVFKIDNKAEFNVSDLLYSIGLSTEEIYFSFPQANILKSILFTLGTIENTSSSEKSLILQQAVCDKLFNTKYYDLGTVGRVKLNERLNLSVPDNCRILTTADIIAILMHLCDSSLSKTQDDDIDNLRNRRVRSVGELLQNQFRIGLNRLERNITEKLTIRETKRLSNIVNPKPIIASIREFFGSSQLSQFLDQINPLSELTHKRRISGLGPGGLNRDHVSFSVRDIHPSHYGRVCPIETPEGQNAGLIASFASFAKVNEYGFIETPYFSVKNGKIIRTIEPCFLTTEKEYEYNIAPGDTKFDRTDTILEKYVPVRYQQDFNICKREDVDFIAISPIQVISAATALIPFIEHDDANRALMGSNMQRQSVPLLFPRKPIVGTGLEPQIAVESGMVVISYVTGYVTYASSVEIHIKSNDGLETIYGLQKYTRSNQDTCINQRPIVWPGEFVYSGQIIADGPSTNDGELALGQNILIAYMPWEGYNYEDAILISQRLVFDDLFTSIHIEKHDLEVRQTKAGPEEIRRNIPYVSEQSIRHLDETGIIYKGAKVKPGDILVGKVTPIGESEQLPEGRLLKAIFGAKAQDLRDTSLRVPNGGGGRVIDIRIFTRENGDDIPTGTICIVRIFLAQIRKVQVGDKMAGRHGNKGIISRILPKQDMPFLPDGTPIDIILNPLGIPSRMNVGQIYECLLGLAGEKLNTRFKVLPFDEMFGSNASRVLILEKLKEISKVTNTNWLFNEKFPGRFQLRDGRTGTFFDNPITVGRSYMLKLIHLVDDKIHARSTGPYSLITQQPLGGRSRNGGQRFGEMEVWALEAFGAAYTLQELLTVKSDDIQGRNQTLDAIIRGHPIPQPGIPESFRVLIRELHSIGIDIETFKVCQNQIGTFKAHEIDLMSSNFNTVKRSNFFSREDN